MDYLLETPSSERRDSNTDGSPCAGCPKRLVCHCLRVSEADLRQALVTFDLRTIKDVRRHTGAGDGCTGCHRRLATYIEEYAQCASSSSDEPICSVR
jgi:bacterioferritin-associated ferredoxin